jgi:TolB-like protein
MPFRNINNDASRDFFCQGLGEFLSTELAHFQELSILSYYSCLHAAGKTSDIHELHNLLGADYVLTGSVLMDKKKIRMLVQLSSKNGEQLWSNTFNRNISGNDFFEIQEEVVDQISAAVGGYYGVIYRDIAEASRLQPANDMATYDAIFWYHKFIKTLDKHTFDQACDALEDAVKNDPEYALAWAVLSEIYSVGISMGFNQLENQKEIAVNYAKRAVKLDPKSQHAYQALARAHFMTHNKAEVISACEKCIALNPRAVSYAARVGGMLIHVGEFERGASLLKESLLLNPFFPWMSSIALSLYHYQRNEFQESREWAAKVDMPQIPWVHLLKVACLGQLDRLDEAKIHIGKLLILKPTISALGKPHLSDYILHEKLVDKLIVGLEKAGLKIQKKVAHQLTVK